MEGWQATSFGHLNAEVYDETQDPGTTEAAVTVIADLARGGKVLELAVGTGRIALPLAARGVDVTGLEVSPQMVAKLRAKPGGDALPVVMADMADFTFDTKFDLVVLVFNTLFNLTSQAQQIGCFQSVANCLAPGGRFLVEAFVPDVARYRDHQDVRIKHLDMGRLTLDAVQHDPVEQRLTMQRLHVDDAGTKLVPLVMRYAWPSELDLMARLAGMTLVDRWSNWDKAPFGADARSAISVWQL
ncbi:MAG: class I SAM-dependent methyltransferase [Pseudomonadota bacterium]